MDVKESVRDNLLRLYKERGLLVAVQVAYNALGNLGDHEKHMNEHDIQFVKTNMNGELCETVLEIVIREWMKEHSDITQEWYISKGLILKDPSRPRSRYLTELDLTLFTPSCVYLFECKSYAGEKRLVDKGMIVRLYGNSCDVFKQNAAHLLTLHNNIKAFSENPQYKMCIFDFSVGKCDDMRDEKYKQVLPYTTISNVLDMLSTGPRVWNMSKLLPAVRIMEDASERLRPQHLKYVKELHNK